MSVLSQIVDTKTLKQDTKNGRNILEKHMTMSILLTVKIHNRLWNAPTS